MMPSNFDEVELVVAAFCKERYVDGGGGGGGGGKGSEMFGSDGFDHCEAGLPGPGGFRLVSDIPQAILWVSRHVWWLDY